MAYRRSYQHRSLVLSAGDWHNRTSVWTQPVGAPVTRIKDLLGIGPHGAVSLADLHAVGLCHGNIKPTSFILGGNSKVLISNHLAGRARQPQTLDLRPPSDIDIESVTLDEGYDVYTLVRTHPGSAPRLQRRSR